MDHEKVYAMSFGRIYPLLAAKAEKKGRTQGEVNEIICWLTGYSEEQIEGAVRNSVPYGDFFSECALPEPGQETDQRGGVRRARGGDQGAADAGDPLPRQAGRRARKGKSDGEDPAQGSMICAP